MFAPKPKHAFRRTLQRVAGVLFAVCLFAAALDIGMSVAFHNRALPHTYLGRADISGKQFSTVASTPQESVVPAYISLRHDGTNVTIAISQFGIRVDIARSLKQVEPIRRWLPLVSLFEHYRIPLAVSYNPSRLTTAAASADRTLSAPAVPEHIVFATAGFTVVGSKNGYALNAVQLGTAVTDTLQAGGSTVDVPTVPIDPPANAMNIQSAIATLQRQLNTQVVFDYHGKQVSPSRTDVGNWFVPSGQTMSLSAVQVRAYINHLAVSLGTSPANPDDLADAVVYMINKELPAHLAFIPGGSETVTRTYCVGFRGVDPSTATDLFGKLAATYNATTGWNDGSRIAFHRVDDGCQDTVWMSAAGSMPSFGAICDSFYSCEVGTNIVLNYDRWSSATDPWNKSGGSLEDYRTLMIDHETGHSLSFLDNPTCPVPGQPAPVMMQQSINLKGCVFNIWPRPAELASLGTMLNLPASDNAASG